MYHAKCFEDQEIYIDSRNADPRDQLFVYFTRSFFWVLSDIALYEGINYDYTVNRDHFYADDLKAICNACDSDGVFPEFDAFCAVTLKEPRLLEVLNHFDGISKNENRHRWNRMVCFHLLVMSFLNSFGNKAQTASDATFTNVCENIQNPEVVANLLKWIDKLGLGDFKELRQLKKTLIKKIQKPETEKIKKNLTLK